MNRLGLIITSTLLLLGSSSYAQTWGCGERDFKCQLDGRMKAFEDDPKNPENYYNIGIVFQRSGAHKEAVESFSMYILIPGLKPEFVADGLNNRAISQRALKKFDLAYADYTKAIELNPKKPEFLVNRGNVSVDARKFDVALADYNRAIVVDPKYAQAYAQRGVLYTNQSKIDEALRDFGKSIEINPTYAEPYYNRGTIYSGRKEFAKAIPDYEKYVSLISDPRYLADGFMNLGIARYYTGSPQKALDDFTKVIELRPTSPNGYSARAMLFREMKKSELAAADEKRAAELTAPPK
ncbi:MAG: tetratricopeptide repeat protein [Chloracidobacterium sp.]|nr:tetratricopeptide repeat protein [Chloracidobacterium sp.]